MLHVKDNFCVIDKYLKNDDKFKYFSLKYNMTSKSVKFFLFFELVGQGLMIIEMYMISLSVAAFFWFLALKKGNFWENPTLVNRYLLPVAMVTKQCKTFLIFYQKCIHLTSIYITAFLKIQNSSF